MLKKQKKTKMDHGLQCKSSKLLEKETGNLQDLRLYKEFLDLTSHVQSIK